MQILKRLFCKYKEVNPVLKPKLPEQGETWYFDDGSPWDTKTTVKILDQKDGWVRYKMTSIFNDERMQLKSFMRMYKFLKSN